jgi:outer membrane biosynthesis protein TonB
MKRKWLILALLGGLALGWVPATRAVKADGDWISRLIARLASPKYAQRRQACRELDAIGEPALAALRQARSAADLETCRLAKELVAKIEQRLDAAAVLAPTRVRLVCKDMPVRDAIAELSRKARIEILIDPASQAKLARRKVTLDTGAVTFWEALDALCHQAGLVETTWQNPNPSLDSTIRTDVLVLPAQPGKLPPAIKRVPGKPKRLPARPPQPKPVQPQAPKPKQVPAQPRKPQKAQAQPQKPKPLPAPAAKHAARGKKRLAQVQFKKAQVQLRQVQLVQFRRAVVRYHLMVDQPAVDHSRIVLADGKPEVVPTCYAGAFCIRARTSAGPQQHSATITLEVTAEPRRLGWNFVGDPRLAKAKDDRGQVLARLQEPRPNHLVMGKWAVQGMAGAQLELVYYNGRGPTVPLKRSISVPLKLGDTPARFAEIAGQLIVEAKTDAQPLIVVDQVLTAGGKTVKGTRGGSLRVLEVARDKNGNHQIRFQREDPPHSVGTPVILMGGLKAVNLQGQIISQTAGQGSAAGNMVLVDAKGVPFALIGSSVTNQNGDVVHCLAFRAEPGRRPARLVFSAQRTVNVPVPFGFKGLKLPGPQPARP